MTASMCLSTMASWPAAVCDLATTNRAEDQADLAGNGTIEQASIHFRFVVFTQWSPTERQHR